MADLTVRPAGSRRMLGDFLGFDPLRALTTSGFGFEINKTENGYAVELPVAGYAPSRSRSRSKTACSRSAAAPTGATSPGPS